MIGSKKLARLLKVLSVETRVEMVRLLKGRALCVNALAAHLNITPGAVSQHLRVMRDAELVIDEKRGYYVHYRLNEKILDVWQGAIEELLNPKAGVRTKTKGSQRCVAAMKSKAARNRKT